MSDRFPFAARRLGGRARRGWPGAAHLCYVTSVTTAGIITAAPQDEPVTTVVTTITTADTARLTAAACHRLDYSASAAGLVTARPHREVTQHKTQLAGDGAVQV